MQETSSESVEDLAQLGGKDDSLGIVQKTEFWPFYQIMYAQNRIRPRKWNA